MKSYQHKWVLPLIILFIILFIAGAVFCGFLIYFELLVPKVRIDLNQGEPVDNDYNNFRAGGRLCRLGDKIYLQYTRANNNYGLLEIGNQTSNRLIWGGPKLKHGDTIMSKIYTDGTQLYSRNSGDTISYPFDWKTNNFLTGVECSVNKYYGSKHFFYIKPFQDSKVYENKNGVVTTLEDGNNYGLYETKDSIYYSRGNRGLHGGESFVRYHLTTQKKEIIFANTAGPTNYYIDEQYMFYKAENTIFVYDLNTKKELKKCIYRPIQNFNVYNRIAYICTDSDIVQYNFKKNELISLAPIAAQEVYIVDDTWVYVRTKDYSWYRIRQDGTGEVETILE